MYKIKKKLITMLKIVIMTNSITYCTTYTIDKKSRQKTINIEIAYGELIDKITILEIKSERIKNIEKLYNIRNELMILYDIYLICIPQTDDIHLLKQKLKKVNEALWDIEDAIRVKEREKFFDQEFISLARNVYTTNDRRCTLKREINELLGSYIIEEKSYEDY